MTEYRGQILVAAALTVGLVAGVFALYSHTIMRGLDKTDDRTFVSAFNEIDKAINNPLFMATFFGALLLTGGAAFLYWRDDDSSVLGWVLAAFILYFISVVLTVAVNVPLNDDLKNAVKDAGGVDQIADLAKVREDFHEDRWVAFNHVRTVLSTVGFGLLLWALVLHGRATADSSDDAAPGAETTDTASR